MFHVNGIQSPPPVNSQTMSSFNCNKFYSLFRTRMCPCVLIPNSIVLCFVFVCDFLLCFTIYIFSVGISDRPNRLVFQRGIKTHKPTNRYLWDIIYDDIWFLWYLLCAPISQTPHSPHMYSNKTANQRNKRANGCSFRSDFFFPRDKMSTSYPRGQSQQWSLFSLLSNVTITLDFKYCVVSLSKNHRNVFRGNAKNKKPAFTKWLMC